MCSLAGRKEDDLLTRMRPKPLLILAVILMACHRQSQVGGANAPPARVTGITSVDQLVQAMHDRSVGKWYRTLTFVQKSTFIRPDAAPRSETWYEAGAIPGRLRIDLGDPTKGNGALYRGDSVYSVQGGKVVDRRAGRNPLMILGFDVY